MNRELARFIRNAIFATPACPDGSNGLACPSCVADFLAEALLLRFEMSDPSAKV
jgi:hypothetical protein